MRRNPQFNPKKGNGDIMMKKVLLGLFYMAVMMMAVYTAEQFTEMIIDGVISSWSDWRTFTENWIHFIVREYDGIALYIFLESVLVTTLFGFGRKFLALFKKENAS